MFQLSGRLSSIAGDPARWQRYEDLRDGLLFTGGRLLRETPDWSLKAGADNVGWRDQRYFGNYERIGRFKISGLWDEIPQFYSVDTRTRVHVAWAKGVLVLRRCRAAAEEPQRLPADLAAIRSARAPRHRHRSRQRDADDAPRPHRRVHDDEALGRAAVGRELRVQQRQRSGAAVPIPHQRRGRRRAVDEQPRHDSRRLQRLVVPQPRRHADLGQPAGADRLDVGARSRPNGAVAVQLAADAEHGGVREARAPDAAHRLAGVRLVRTTTRHCCRSRSTARCRSSRCRVRPPRPRPTRSRRTSASCRVRRTTGGSAHGSAATTTTTTRRRRRSRQFINYDTSVATSARPAVRSCLRTTAIRSTPTPRGPASVRWRSRLATPTTTTATTFASSSRPTRTCCSSRPTRSACRWVTFRAHYEYGSRTGSGLDEASLVEIGEQPQHAALRSREPHAQPVRRPGGRRRRPRR